MVTLLAGERDINRVDPELGAKPMSAFASAQTIVLVVEDDAALRALYRTSLRSAGYAVVAFEDGLDALAFADSTVPAAVVLDLGLPRIDGRDVQRELAAHESTRSVPVIVVTGQGGDVDEHAFACVLRKPVQPDALVEAVRNCLRRKRADG
jgi:DNA-binding response OmpR family regulator